MFLTIEKNSNKMNEMKKTKKNEPISDPLNTRYNNIKHGIGYKYNIPKYQYSEFTGFLIRSQRYVGKKGKFFLYFCHFFFLNFNF